MFLVCLLLTVLLLIANIVSIKWFNDKRPSIRPYNVIPIILLPMAIWALWELILFIYNMGWWSVLTIAIMIVFVLIFVLKPDVSKLKTSLPNLSFKKIVSYWKYPVRVAFIGLCLWAFCADTMLRIPNWWKNISRSVKLSSDEPAARQGTYGVNGIVVKNGNGSPGDSNQITYSTTHITGGKTYRMVPVPGSPSLFYPNKAGTYRATIKDPTSGSTLWIVDIVTDGTYKGTNDIAIISPPTHADLPEYTIIFDKSMDGNNLVRNY